MFFWITANILFFQRWYTKINNSHTISHNRKKKQYFWNKFKRKIVIQKDSIDYQIFKWNKAFNSVFDNIYIIDNKYFYVKEERKNTVSVQDITTEINGQKELLYNTIWLILLFWFLSYFISRYFVKTSLKELQTLVSYLQKSDLNNLENIPIQWNKKDEINIVAIKINHFLKKINQQTLTLKDFIANASHELKTPMMTMNSNIDYALKSKEYKTWLEQTKKEIKTLNNLLEELFLLTTFSQEKQWITTQEEVSEIIKKTIIDVQKNYKNKNIIIKINLIKVKKNINKEWFSILTRNIIENAFKYTEQWEISISNNQNNIIISDTGIGISSKNLEKIWERFRQADSSRWENAWFWLWLHLVKLLIEKHNRKIQVKSKKDRGTTFTILY